MVSEFKSEEIDAELLDSWTNSFGILINDDWDRLNEYVGVIADMVSDAKLMDLAEALAIAGVLQNTQVSADTYDKVQILSAEANNRLYAHIMAIKEKLGFSFLPNIAQTDIVPICVDIAVDLRDEADPSAPKELAFKAIKLIGEKIFD